MLLANSKSDECFLVPNREGVLANRPEGHPLGFYSLRERREVRLFKNAITAEEGSLRNRARNSNVVVEND